MFPERFRAASLHCNHSLNARTKKRNEDKAQAIYFSGGIRTIQAYLLLNGRNIPFVNRVKYLGVILLEAGA
jgi:hypothetical protein